MRPANERRRYKVTSSLIGWAHTRNDPCIHEAAFIQLRGIESNMTTHDGYIHKCIFLKENVYIFIQIS